MTKFGQGVRSKSMLPYYLYFIQVKKMLENKTKMQHELTQKLGRFITHFKALSDKLKEIFEVSQGSRNKKSFPNGRAIKAFLWLPLQVRNFIALEKYGDLGVKEDYLNIDSLPTILRYTP